MTKQVQVRIAKEACLVGIAIFALAGFCVSQSASDWPQLQNNNMQRWNPNETVINVDNAGRLGTKWSYKTGSWVYSTPVVANGVVYVASEDNNLYALNATTGAKLWSFATSDRVYFPAPAVANGMVYIGSSDSKVYALNASTGALVWSFTTGNIVDSSPAVANGVVYVSSGDNNVYALNASTGILLWSYATGGGIFFSSPAVANGSVYVGSADGNVYALNATTGALLWKYTTTGYVAAAPAVASGVVYINSEDGNVYALNAATGTLLWSNFPGAAMFAGPAVANGMVYVGSEDGNLYALSASTGTVLWTFAATYMQHPSPAVANGVVYAAGEDESVYAINAATGALLWSHPAGAISSITVANGTVYVGSDTSNVYAFDLSGTSFELSSVAYPTPPVTGGSLTYAFKIWNKTSENAVHEVLTTQVPAGTTFTGIALSGTAGLGSCTTPAVGVSGAVVCKENSVMRPGSTWTIRMTVRITARAGTVLTETATASSDNAGSSSMTVHNTVR